MRESATTHSIALLVRTPTHGRQFMSQTTERTATPRTDRNAIKIINQSVRIEALDGIRLGRRDESRLEAHLERITPRSQATATAAAAAT